jgi:hypothetical protein
MINKENNENPIIIYWAPAYDVANELDWNMLYQEPENLFLNLVKEKEKKSGVHSMFNCPAVSDRLKNSFVFKNLLKTTFSYDFLNEENPLVKPINGINASYYKPSNFIGGGNVALAMSWIFFAEEPVNLLINTPMLHKTKLSEHGFIVPGGYDASKWFRPISAELQMWDKKAEVTIEEDDPLFYLEVVTDRKVILKRFKMNNKLTKYKHACADSPQTMGSRLPLKNRYNKFIKSRMNEIVLKEIKNNLV